VDDALDTLAGAYDLDSQLMAEDAGILKEGLNALIGMEIRAANTDVAYPNDGVILLQRRTITQAIFEIPRFGAG